MKKKPALSSAAPKEEKKSSPDEDVEMAAPAPPKRKFGEAPPKRQPTTAPKPTAGSAVTKPLTGGTKAAVVPQVEEADLGEGLSKEEAIEKVKEFYSAEAMKNFDKQKITNEEDGSSEMKDPSWQNKTEGFKQMMTEIISN